MKATLKTFKTRYELVQLDFLRAYYLAYFDWRKLKNIPWVLNYI